MRRCPDRASERGVAARIPGRANSGACGRVTGERTRIRGTVQCVPWSGQEGTGPDRLGCRAPRGRGEARKSEGGMRGSAARRRGGRIQTGMAGLARQPGKKAVAAHKTHDGARRSALGARRSALGARRSALGARRSIIVRTSAICSTSLNLGFYKTIRGPWQAPCRFPDRRTDFSCNRTSAFGGACRAVDDAGGRRLRRVWSGTACIFVMVRFSPASWARAARPGIVPDRFLGAEPVAPGSAARPPALRTA